MDYKKDKKPKTNKKKTNGKKTTGKRKLKLINNSGLHHTIKKQMINHAQNHSMKHIGFMINKIDNGKKYNEAHLLAQKSIGR